MFFLLVAVVSIHQLYSTLIHKKDKWPLRSIGLRFLEFMGRVFLFPFIILYYILRIDSLPITYLIPMSFIVVFIWYRESFGLMKICQLALKNLIGKANNPESKLIDFSKGEIFVLNYLMFKRISFQFQDIANHLLSKGQLDVKSSRDLSPNLRDVDEILERERHTGSGVGIQLLSSSAQRQLRKEIKQRRKYGHDSDDEDEEEDTNIVEQYGKRRNQSQSSIPGESNILSNPIHRM